MKSLRLSVSSVLLSAALLAAGCSSTSTKPGDAGASVEDRGDIAGVQTSGAAAGGAWTGSALDNPDSPLYRKVIYFEFDQSDIRPEDYDTLRAHADYLAANRLSITIEGHADERGSREYNIALGERRANTVKRFLEAEGVDPSQLSTVSYGEERPDNPGSDEYAWSRNRRAVLAY